MKNHNIQRSGAILYHHIVAVEKLELNKQYQLFKGHYLALLNRKEKIFAVNKNARFIEQMINDINTYGKFRLEILYEHDDFYLFTPIPQKFVPSEELIYIY